MSLVPNYCSACLAHRDPARMCESCANRAFREAIARAASAARAAIGRKLLALYLWRRPR